MASNRNNVLYIPSIVAKGYSTKGALVFYLNIYRYVIICFGGTTANILEEEPRVTALDFDVS